VQGEYAVWDKYLSKFRYGKELRQHLYTGHAEIYSLLNKTTSSENAFVTTFQETFDKVKDKIRRELRTEISFEVTPQSSGPSFNEEPVIHHIMDKIETDKWDGFRAYMITRGRVIVSKGQKYDFYNSDEGLANKLALKLNDIVRDAEISNAITNYRNIRKEKDEACSAFEQQLGELIRGIMLKARVFSGACDHCLAFHDKKDIGHLKSSLSQIE
jgi:hypothetical protein